MMIMMNVSKISRNEISERNSELNGTGQSQDEFQTIGITSLLPRHTVMIISVSELDRVSDYLFKMSSHPIICIFIVTIRSFVSSIGTLNISKTDKNTQVS